MNTKKRKKHVDVKNEKNNLKNGYTLKNDKDSLKNEKNMWM